MDPFTRKTLYASGTGATVTTTVPDMKRIVAFQFDRPALLRAFDASTTILTELGAAVVCLVLDNQLTDTIGLDGRGDILATHITDAPALPALASPSSRIWTLDMPREGISIAKGVSISVYAGLQNSANNRFFSAFTLHVEYQ